MNEKPLPPLAGVVLGVMPKLKVDPVPLDEDVGTVEDDGFAKLKALLSLAFVLVVVVVVVGPKRLAVFEAPNGEGVLVAPNGEGVLPDALKAGEVFVLPKTEAELPVFPKADELPPVLPNTEFALVLEPPPKKVGVVVVVLPNTGFAGSLLAVAVVPPVPKAGVPKPNFGVVVAPVIGAAEGLKLNNGVAVSFLSDGVVVLDIAVAGALAVGIVDTAAFVEVLPKLKLNFGAVVAPVAGVVPPIVTLVVLAAGVAGVVLNGAAGVDAGVDSGLTNENAGFWGFSAAAGGPILENNGAPVLSPGEVAEVAIPLALDLCCG